ncbi:MAG TPA: NAD(P)/FAD-dependent oxidoreductase [Mycobacteriales bacterium]|nr:NAD(P)/FAD-dependent oxidoreductase [Mycobacteriales bacterium]
MSWDAVVVGAGHHGLVAANLLADAGWSVLVLEANATPGGATRTAELAAPGYRSDLCSAFYPLTAVSPVIDELGLDEYGLHWLHDHHVPLVHVLPDDRTVTLSRDPAETAASVEEFAPGDGERWQAEFAGWRRMREHLVGALLSPFPPVRSGAGLVRRLGVADTMRFARFAVQSTRRYGQDAFRGQGARMLVAGNAMHADLTLDASGSALLGWLLSMLAQDVGYPVAAGGAQSIADALVRRLEARGGEVRCGVRVTGVEVRDGRAVGVRTADGDGPGATRAVLADVPAPALYLDLVGAEHLPARVRDDLDRFHWDDATVKVDWALSGRVPWSNPAVARAGTVHLDLDLDLFGRFALDLADGRIPERPFILAGQMTTADPSRSPAGTESLWAYTHVPHGLTWTPELTEQVAGRMQATIERHAPGFGDLVVGRAVASPAGLQAENASLVDGAIAGGTAALFQQLVLRPTPGLGRADTPIDRLFLASASAHPGGGVHGACGANAARAALARDRAGTGLLYRAAIGSAGRAVWGRTP